MSADMFSLTLAIACILPAYTFYQLFYSGQRPKGVPWGPSGKNGFFPALKSSIKTALDIRKTFTLSNVLPFAQSHGFMFSTVLDGAVVALPMRNLRWLANLPEKTASFYQAQEERIQMSYTIPADTLTDPDLTRLLVKVLTRRTKSVVSDMHDEIQSVCRDSSYAGSEWQSLCLYGELVRILSATSNRMLIGLPLCNYQVISLIHEHDPNIEQVAIPNFCHDCQATLRQLSHPRY